MATNTPPANDHADDNLTDEVQALLAATAEAVGDDVAEARRRLGVALESGKRIIGKVKDQVIESAATTDLAVRKHPYVAIGLAFGAGTFIGYLLSRRMASPRD